MCVFRFGSGSCASSPGLILTTIGPHIGAVVCAALFVSFVLPIVEPVRLAELVPNPTLTALPNCARVCTTGDAVFLAGGRNDTNSTVRTEHGAPPGRKTPGHIS